MNISPMKNAWRHVFQERTCPPHAVLTDPGQAANVAEHRKSCPVCAMMKETKVDYELWKEFGKQLVAEWPAPGSPDVGSGQVWSLRRCKGGWDAGFRHINPPLVLVLEVFGDVDGIRVAQVFDEGLLAHEGDVELGHGLGLAESWNTYALDRNDLDLCFGQVDASTLEAVKAAGSGSVPELDEFPTIWHFRQLELEVGSFMAMDAMGRLMERHERNAVREEFADVGAVRAKVLAFDSRIRLGKAENGLEMVATAELPEELMLKAAAGEEGLCPFTVVSVGGTTNRCHGALAELLELDHRDTVIRVTGRIPEEYSEGLLFAWWRRSDVGLEEGMARFEPSEGIFSASFPGKSELDFELGEPVLLLVQIDDAHD